MRKLVTALTLVALTMAGTPTVASAKAKTGQKIFKKKIRKYCGFSGVKFARHHSQEEWEEIWYDDGMEGFKEEFKRICPKLPVKKVPKKWWNHLYDFSYEYGTGGSHVPKC